MNKDIVIFGNTDLARLALHYFNIDTSRKVVAFCVDDAWLNADSFQGLPLVAYSTLARNFPPSNFEVFVAMGYGNLNGSRRDVFNRLLRDGYDFASYISSKATILSNQIGRNAFILEDNTIQPYVQIGDDVTLWSGNHIGHDAIIGNHVFVTSHVVVGGYAEIGEMCFVGINSSVRNEVKVGRRSIIGAGSLVMEDVREGSVLIPRGTKPLPISVDEYFHSGFTL